MSAMPTVLLFDVDGTLINNGGVGRLALQRAFQELYGRADAISFRLGGMTDESIVRRALESIGLDPVPAVRRRTIELYLEHLRAEVSRAAPDRFIVHPGVSATLEAARRANVAIGLGTGNVRRGAEIKLQHVGLYKNFAFGGFGCDAEDRVELLRTGARRGAAILGSPLEHCRVVVIGDTPHDVTSAHAIGATCIAVGTGRYSCSELSAAGARATFVNLAAPGALQALLDPEPRPDPGPFRPS